MNEKFNKNVKVEQLTEMLISSEGKTALSLKILEVLYFVVQKPIISTPSEKIFIFTKASLYVKASAHSFKQLISRLFLIIFLSLSMHLYTSDGRHAWFHLHRTSRPARCASEATKYKMKNSCPHRYSNPQSSDFKSDALPTELARLGECCSFKLPYYIHVLPIPMFTLL